MNLQERIRQQLIETNYGNQDLEKLETAYRFLKKEEANLSYTDKTELQNKNLELADQVVRHTNSIEFICASLFFNLVNKKDADFIGRLKNTLGENIALIVKSYGFAKKQLADNEIYLRHSFNSAQILSSIRLSAHPICAAMLHELPSRTNTKISEIATNFNKEIATLIENFEKIHHLKVSDNAQYIANLKEMVIAMAKDLRVILIKMCSNIDRLTTLEFGTDQEIKDIARESMDVLAPIADLLGIWELRWQLEDLAFKIIDPENFKMIEEKFRIDEKKNREKYIQKTRSIIAKAAKDAGISCRIDGRFKHFYSIYQKMLLKNKSFNEIGDVFALRIVVTTEDECYRMLGQIHKIWKPKQKRIKDYIAAPKSNHYQSLHTTVFGLNGRPTEFQIRTYSMDEEANFGVAAHWFYKNSLKKAPIWMQDLLLKQQKFSDDEEFYTNFSSEILSSRIYVYTPKGDVIPLPQESTPIDFAYHVHTELGNKCVGALINDQPVPLDQSLKTNDVVQILVDRKQEGPNPNWLTFVKTNAAKRHIEIFKNKATVERYPRF